MTPSPLKALPSREELLKNDPEFRTLFEEHQGYDKRLDALSVKRFLTDEEKLEESELKKKKLFLKDRMERHLLSPTH